MYIRLTIGRYAGDIREFPPHVAQQLLRNGHATDPFAEEPEPQRIEPGEQPLGVENQNRVLADEIESAPKTPTRKTIKRKR